MKNCILNKRCLTDEALREMSLWEGRVIRPVYVGRPTIFGNRFIIGKDGDRNECCDLFDEWAWHPNQAAWREAVIAQLTDKDLLCWCAPNRCHAETLRDICNVDKLLS